MANKLAAVPNHSIFNAVRLATSKQFQDRIPAANLANMQQIGLAITANRFKTELNEWQHQLINRIGLTIFHDYTIKNRLAKYIYGRMDFGDAIQEIGVGLVKGRTMDYGEEGKSLDPFIKVSPQAKALYHRVNAPIQYCTTIERDRLNRAFLNTYGISRLIGFFLNAMYSSANLDTWLLTKSTMAYYINDGMAAEGLPLLPTQKVGVEDVVDEATARAFLLKIKNAVTSMEFPQDAYNPMRIPKTLDNRELTLFVRADILNTIGVDLLATAFHIDQLNLPVRVEPMDNFGTDPAGNGTDDILAVLAEDNWLLITEQFEDMEEIYNPRGRYWNYFLTRAMSFGTTYFKDAIIFGKRYLGQGG